MKPYVWRGRDEATALEWAEYEQKNKRANRRYEEDTVTIDHRYDPVLTAVMRKHGELALDERNSA